MYAVSWREGGGKQANVHAIVTSPEISINEAEPCRRLAIAMGCMLQQRNKQASIHEVTGLVTPALGRPGDEAEV